MIIYAWIEKHFKNEMHATMQHSESEQQSKQNLNMPHKFAFSKETICVSIVMYEFTIFLNCIWSVLSFY